MDRGDVEVLLAGARSRGQRALSEYESKQVLAAYGIPVVREQLVRDAAMAMTVAREFGYPVVVKACSPALTHKSDKGLVRLNVSNDGCVETAIAELRAAAGPGIDGFLVQPMVRGKRELIVGGLRDPLFGPCVMLGLGGILVEVVGDVTFRLAPIEERDALEMVNELRGRGMFEAVRGEPAADRAALSGIVLAVGSILAAHPGIGQIDVNPVILEGAKPVAVDGLIALGDG